MTASRATYEAAFAEEQARAYAGVDAFERQVGHAIDRPRLEAAASILACPVKKHPPCWQHGRVLYAVASRRLAQLTAADGPVRLLDIGTAKGFSALCLQYALDDAALTGVVTTVDVIDPHEAVRRNTVAEVDGFKTLAQILESFPAAADLVCLQRTGVQHLSTTAGRIHVAFVDGKHTGAVVAEESQLLARRQAAGDVAVWDDVHLGDVRQAVERQAHNYELQWLQVLPHRAYAIGVRR